ncbi:hypothetical protein [Streptomyces sp. NPDC089799]|uniref:hypothetical protein n=1 Tax=Streptomyces sp. NPDC089799 TaxID=3155066 RepID=UPI003444DEAF
MSARRPLLTALGATTLLGAFWFVPSANATAPEQSGPPASGTTPVNGNTAVRTAAGTTGAAGAQPAAPRLALADTGGPDTTPYVFGGVACLGVGAGFVVLSASRTRGR